VLQSYDKVKVQADDAALLLLLWLSYCTATVTNTVGVIFLKAGLDEGGM
jgi:hypothetical protein